MHDQLRLAMQMRLEADAFPVLIGDQMHAVAGRAVAARDGGKWPLGDSHWLHPVRIRTYNRAVKSGIDQGIS